MYISPITGPRCPEGSTKLRFPDYVTIAQNDGKVVSLTHRSFLPPRKYSWYSFLLEAESSPVNVNEKFQWHHLESNQRPYDLQRSALTTVLPRSPKLLYTISDNILEWLVLVCMIVQFFCVVFKFNGRIYIYIFVDVEIMVKSFFTIL